jgi:DNA repair exonuclease SbcCD ATPase subunit
MIGVKYRSKLDKHKGHVDTLTRQLSTKEKQLTTTRQELIDVEEATVFVQEVAMATQGLLKIQIEDVVSLALESILDNPYTFELEFVRSGSKTECNLWFVRGGQRVNPVDDTGGGAVDIAAFAIRVALRSIGGTDNVLVFDEPFKFVSANYRDRVAELVQKLSSRLGLQIIMVTHEPSLVQHSDNVLTVTQTKGVSHVSATL